LEEQFLRAMRSREGWEGEFDLAHVDDIAAVGPSAVEALKKKSGRVSCYVIDDPFGNRDGWKWRLFLKAVPKYDLITVVREPNVEEAYDHGATDVLRVYRSADEVVHAPLELSQEERERWSSKVTFVGTWFPERGPFMKRLIERGVPLTIRGNGWQNADEWDLIEPYWEGPALQGENYTKALQCAEICLGLLSKGNRDLHTQRSIEIPYLGSLFCAERTKEHRHLYEEGKEAVFWDDADECADRCFELLADEERRKEIETRGQDRCVENKHFNEVSMDKIIDNLL
jgi:spore maturation protein CgeB